MTNEEIDLLKGVVASLEAMVYVAPELKNWKISLIKEDLNWILKQSVPKTAITQEALRKKRDSLMRDLFYVYQSYNPYGELEVDVDQLSIRDREMWSWIATTAAQNLCTCDSNFLTDLALFRNTEQT